MTTDQSSPLDFPLPDKGVAVPPRKAGEPGDPAQAGNVLYGVGIGLSCNIGAVLISWLVSAEMMLLGIGLFQLIWLVPTWVLLRVKGLKRTALGVLILAAVVFLLNSACWGVGLMLFSNMH